MVWTEKAEAAITAYQEAADGYARLMASEDELEARTPAVKHAAILRIMEEPNPLNGKAHSATSASDLLWTDQEYAAHRTLQQQVALQKHHAHALMTANRLRAELAIAAIRTEPA